MPDREMNGKLVLEVRDLTKWFPVRRSLRETVKGSRNWVRAVDGVSFGVREGEILALVGESGCGKTTTGKVVMKILDPTSGSIYFRGEESTTLTGSPLDIYRRQVQMIFQDPYASMNPRFRIRDVLEEPLQIHHIGSTREERGRIVSEALEKVKLTPAGDYMQRFPHMLSGGQRQRAATARTLILSPALLVADEPVSMIDLSTRAEILAMMKEVRTELGLSYLYITHDLSTARYFADRIAVMYLGRIVEIGPAGDIVDSPAHPYSRALVAAVCEPVPGKVRELKQLPIKGEIPSAAAIPTGCRFHPRCVFAKPECSERVQPELEAVGEGGHLVACHRWKEI